MLHNISRIEAFSDAVFAFAATLMVVNFDMNENIALVETRGVSIFSFGVSFFVLVGLWVLHYNFFRRTNYMDYWIITINAILLFVVLYYVFPLKSLITSWFGDEKITQDGLATLFELYSLGFVFIFLCLSLMYYRAYKKSKEVDNSLDLFFYARHFGIFVIVSIVSVLLATFNVGLKYGIPGLIYFILGPLCHLHGIWFQKNIRNKITS